MPFDINGPLEAVHRDTGQVVKTRLDADYPQPGSDGDYRVEILPGSCVYFNADGSPSFDGNPWHLRNRAPDLPTYNPATHALVPWQSEDELYALLGDWALLTREGDGEDARAFHWLAKRLGFHREPPAPPTLRDRLIANVDLTPEQADKAIAEMEAGK